MLHVILHEPEIPPNTGNIIRLCANSGCRLHLIEPLGFDTDARALRRAGLDYHALADVQRHRNLDACLQALPGSRLLIVETVGGRLYSDEHYRPGDALLFGSETRGLPAAVLAAHPEAPRLLIPMLTAGRSLNLANAVSVVVYEAWRQLGFAGAPPPSG